MRKTIELCQRAIEVSSYYDQNVDVEWNRINRYPIEFALLIHLIKEYANKESKILDAGGGPGRYSLWLAETGYDVHILDLSMQNLCWAYKNSSSKHLKLIRGDVVNLEFMATNYFDLVLLLGPLYHIPDEGERNLVFHNINRILKSGGVLITEQITIHSNLKQTKDYVPYANIVDPIGASIEFQRNNFEIITQIGLNNPTKYSCDGNSLNDLLDPIWKKRVREILCQNENNNYWKCSEILIHVAKKY